MAVDNPPDVIAGIRSRHLGSGENRTGSCLAEIPED